MSHLFAKLVNVEGDLYPSLYEYVDPDYDESSLVVYDARLTQRRIEFVKQLTPDQIVKVDVVDTWEDDHEMCLAVDITFDNGDIMSIAACWLYPEFVSSFYRPDDACKSEIIEYLQDQISL
jgi:hypothetical protein